MVQERLNDIYDYLKYQEMAEDFDYYFKNKKVVNFDIINHECRGDRLKKKLIKNIIQLKKKILMITQKKKKTLFFLQFLELNEMIYGLNII